MSNLNLIILSYHTFGWEPSDYQFSRTYKDFDNDIHTKQFDMITIDDARESMIKACDMLRAANIRAKLFVPTELVGNEGYCNWKQLKELSKFHDIENHSHAHINLQEVSKEEVNENISQASYFIERIIGRKPRYFVPPFNKSSQLIEDVATRHGMQLISNRIDILNSTP